MTCSVVTWLVFLRNTKKICKDDGCMFIYSVIFRWRASLLPYPWTRWTLRSSTTSTHEPSGLDSSNRRKQVRRGERDCKITISLACQINIAKLSSCIHFFFSFCIPYLNGCLVPLKVGCADGYAALPMPLFLHSYTQLFAPCSLRRLRTIFNHLIKFFSIQFNSIQEKHIHASYASGQKENQVRSIKAISNCINCQNASKKSRSGKRLGGKIHSINRLRLQIPDH